MGDTQHTLGLFSYVPSISLGCPYNSKAGSIDDRQKGKQFLTTPSKKGSTPDVTFTRFSTVSVGTPYSPPLQNLQRGEKSSKESVSQPPFRPSSPTKTSQGSGSYYGCFGVWKNMKTTNNYDKVHAKSPDTGLKNFLIRPPKKGGCGTIGLNIGGNPEGHVGEYKYYPEPAPARPSSAPSELALKPFVPSSPPQKGTYGYMNLNINGMSRPKGCVGEYTYQSEPLDRFKRAEDASKDVKPFRPSSPSRKGRGFYGTFTWSGQTYMSDTDSHSKDMKKSPSNPDLPKYGVFKPCSGSKSLRVTSIANHPRNLEGGHPVLMQSRLARTN
uniref:Cilia-and flagella-associated protein 96 n=1 Tax=Guillardia theta TaxID=55529 RepID=A0A7S4PNG5_GUITH|mmetsp:Transcript_6999/g.24448  ORF Transcript_6999/g.24448 Transcript_6999/m.24448 type:complete len:327 (+) Transcript_6999:13-993(+)